MCIYIYVLYISYVCVSLSLNIGYPKSKWLIIIFRMNITIFGETHLALAPHVCPLHPVTVLWYVIQLNL